MPLIHFDLGQLPTALPSQSTYVVQKTGFPFYDACQLVGAMHLFFGSGVSSIQDRTSHWEISGSTVGSNTANYGERLKGKGLERVDQTTLSLLDELEQQNASIQDYFGQPFPKSLSNWPQEKVSRFLEPAWLTGARSSDAARYNVLASEQGLPSNRPKAEVLVATLGLTRCALAYGNDEVLTVLPVMSNTLIPLDPFMTLKQRYQHAAGGSISAVYAGLGILVELAHKQNIQDFAFAYHGGRGFYYSGLLGLHKLCSQFRKNTDPDLAKQALAFFNQTSSADTGIVPDLARLLAEFLKNPSIKILEGIARNKARILCSDSIKPYITAATRQLLSTTAAIKEAIGMAILENKLIPVPSNGLIKALGEVFRSDKGWIGSYINLERADKADAFYAEISKILSRAIARAEKDRSSGLSVEKLQGYLAGLQSQDVLQACEPQNLRYFAAHKTTFLLRVLGSMRPERSDKTQTPESQAPEGDDA